MKELKDLVDDALHATRAAIEEGIVPGGGVALIRAIPALDALKLTGDEAIGVGILKRALSEPMKQIVNNAGIEGAVVVNNVKENSNFAYGFNARTEVYEDLIASGVMDPTKVTITALENAASVASLFLTTECVIAEKPETNKPAMPQMDPGMMGGY